MSRVRSLVLASALIAGLTSTLTAQDRGVVVQVLGGGYSHVNNLRSQGVMSTAHWNTGFNVAAAIGYQASKYFGVHADLTMARNKAIGATPFAGESFNRYFYGGHVELRFPVSERVSPFLFAGGGGVTIDQVGTGGLDTFSKPAAMFGAGMNFAIPNSRVALLLEGKGLAFKWDRGSFNKTQFDVSYSFGLAYNFGW